MSTVTKGNVDSGGAQITPAFSATQQNKRDVWPHIVHNFARYAPLISLTSHGQFDKQGISKGPGLIGKAIVSQVRYESYNYTPPPSYTTATAVLSGTTLPCDTTYLKYGDTLFNTENETVARIDSITSATACVITSIGATAFSVAEGDVLSVNANAYGQNSSNPSIMSKDFDNVYNTLQISREPVGISNSMLKSEFYATMDYFGLLKMINMVNFLQKIERAWLFGQRASSGNTTAGGAYLTSSFYTTRGAWNWAANRYDMKGSLSMFKLRSEIPGILDTVASSDKVTMLMGKGTYGRINDMMNGQASYQISGSESQLKKYGIETRVIKTNNMDLELITHPSFDIGAMKKKALVLTPEQNRFVHLKDRDIRPVVGIQNNDVDGKIDSVEAEFGCQTLDGGQSTVAIENIW